MCDNPNGRLAKQLGAAARALRAGGVVAFPTDTVYGLGCNALNPVAAVRIFEIKRRPRHMALPVLIAGREQLAMAARAVPQVAEVLMDRFWPGALTLVLPRQQAIPDIVTARSDCVAVRLPDHSVPVFLARSLGAPLVGTSANVHGMPVCRTAEEVRRQLGDEVDLIVDGGETPGGKESTVVAFKNGMPNIVREGAILSDTIINACREAGLCA